jgi:hypothetical protein
MRLLKFLLFVPTIIVASKTPLTCEEKCIKKEKYREDMERCRYVLYMFPKKGLLQPPIHYQHLYSNETQTTIYSLNAQRDYCTDRLVETVINIIIYVLIFIWIVSAAKDPVPYVPLP